MYIKYRYLRNKIDLHNIGINKNISAALIKGGKIIINQKRLSPNSTWTEFANYKQILYTNADILSYPLKFALNIIEPEVNK